MKVSERIFQARAELQREGVAPDTCELTPENIEALGGTVSPALWQSFAGMKIIPSEENRVGGYRHQPKRLQVVGREWVAF